MLRTLALELRVLRLKQPSFASRSRGLRVEVGSGTSLDGDLQRFGGLLLSAAFLGAQGLIYVQDLYRASLDGLVFRNIFLYFVAACFPQALRLQKLRDLVARSKPFVVLGQAHRLMNLYCLVALQEFTLELGRVLFELLGRRRELFGLFHGLSLSFDLALDFNDLRPESVGLLLHKIADLCDSLHVISAQLENVVQLELLDHLALLVDEAPSTAAVETTSHGLVEVEKVVWLLAEVIGDLGRTRETSDRGRWPADDLVLDVLENLLVLLVGLGYETVLLEPALHRLFLQIFDEKDELLVEELVVAILAEEVDLFQIFRNRDFPPLLLLLLLRHFLQDLEKIGVLVSEILALLN